MEHILLFVKVLFDSWAKVPEDVLLKYHVRFYEKSRILEEFDNKDPEQDVAFFTSDEGPLYYHSAGATKKGFRILHLQVHNSRFSTILV
eukprot:23803_5